MTAKAKTRVLWLTFLVAVGLLAGAVNMAYSLYKDLEATLREVQSAYAQEQGKTEKLSRRADELTKSVDEGRVRESQLRETQRVTRDEKLKLEAELSRLEAAAVRWQAAYNTEQAKTNKLTETAKDLLGVMEQAQNRLKSLDEGLKKTKEEKTRLEAKTKTLEIALKRWQTSHAAEQAKNRMLNERAEKLTNIAEKAQDRVHTLEQAEIGRRAKRDIERKWEEKSKNWGKDFRKAIRFMFF